MTITARPENVADLRKRVQQMATMHSTNADRPSTAMMQGMMGGMMGGPRIGLPDSKTVRFQIVKGIAKQTSSYRIETRR